MDRPEVSLELMRCFVRVAERGSLSAVARETGRGQSTISRQLRQLEEALGVALVSRTTRQVALTGEGHAYYRHCLDILRLVERAGDEVRGSGGRPAGKIRISATLAFGTMHLTHILFDFQDAYPDVSIDLHLTDERVNLVEEGIDLAVRMGALEDSSLKMRRLGWSRRLLVARAGLFGTLPQRPEQLEAVDFVTMMRLSDNDRLVLAGPGGESYTMRCSGRLRVDPGLAVREALRAGRGIGIAHHWLVGDLLESGELVALLPGWTVAPVPLSLLIAPGQAEMQRIRLLIDFLTDRCAAVQGIES